ncbi:hypothetical protein VNO77_02597 [Canavalia gladiata]|uniref:Uncharacterized protein n=1 Tax=Canavalia gladiata TaxID=3824 RepID=A0AAN9R366_CANGL
MCSLRMRILHWISWDYKDTILKDDRIWLAHLKSPFKNLALTFPHLHRLSPAASTQAPSACGVKKDLQVILTFTLSFSQSAPLSPLHRSSLSSFYKFLDSEVIAYHSVYVSFGVSIIAVYAFCASFGFGRCETRNFVYLKIALAALFAAFLN